MKCAVRPSPTVAPHSFVTKINQSIKASGLSAADADPADAITAPLSRVPGWVDVTSGDVTSDDVAVISQNKGTPEFFCSKTKRSGLPPGDKGSGLSCSPIL